MHDFYYSRLLNDVSKFAPRAGNRCVKVVESETDGGWTLAQREIVESEIDDWIKDDPLVDPGSHQDGNLPRKRPCPFRLVIGSPEQHESDAKILPLPISQDTFETVRTAWSLPTELLRMMLSTLPIATDFRTTDASGEPITGLMMRSARSRDWSFCLGLVYNERTGILRGILNGMQADEIQLLFTCLQESRQHLHNPLLLPVFLIELKVHYFAVLLEKRAEGIEAIEYTTGMRHGFSSNPRRNTGIDREREKFIKELDFDPITQKLTGVTGTLSFCDMTFASSLRALDLVMELRKRLSSGSGQRRQEDETESQSALDTRMVYLRELIVGAQAHGAVLSARTSAQVQTVYSLIGQKDNKLNIETAAASRKIAEISLRHNTAMKEMAEDSRNIAILTRKDSTDMRIIAVVTLMFLPGTFMATLFSSGFFNFLPNRSTQVVSGWIWLYFVLTGASTLVVFIAWYQFSKKQNKQTLTVIKIDKELPRSGSKQVHHDDHDFASGSPPAHLTPRLWTERSRSIAQSVDIDPFASVETRQVDFK